MKKSILTLEEAKLLADIYPTPFYIYDEKAIRENVRELIKAFSWNKGYREYFAVKANPNPILIDILREEGCGVDCSSYTELMLSEAMKFEGDDIFFSSNDTPAEDFKYARRLNAKINLDDITHIDFLDKIAGLPEEICCRYNPGSNFEVNNQIMDNPSEAKYGFTFEQLIKGFRELRKRGVKRVGIHAFLASNCIENDYYPTLARTLFETMASLKRDFGIVLSFVNLSGGIGIPYLPNQKKVDIAYVGQEVKRAYDEVLLPERLTNVDIYTELGRFLLGSYGQLVTTVLHKKNIHKNYIQVDSCSVDLMRPALYKAYHEITVLGKENDMAYTYDVVGSLCENNDKFAIDRLLPEINIGDILVIHDAGAHGHAMGYNYNGKLRCAEILKKEDNTYQLIRRKQTPKDYFSTLDIHSLFSE